MFIRDFSRVSLLGAIWLLFHLQDVSSYLIEYHIVISIAWLVQNSFMIHHMDFDFLFVPWRCFHKICQSANPFRSLFVHVLDQRRDIQHFLNLCFIGSFEFDLDYVLSRPLTINFIWHQASGSFQCLEHKHYL